MKSVLFALAVLAVSPAFAQSSTEFFHQAAGGASEVTPHVGYRTATTHSTTANSSDVNMNGVDRLGVQYEYGINPLLSLGADLSYSSYKFSGGGSGDSKGLEPLRVLLKGQLPMAMGSFQYGVGASFGLEKAKTTTDNVNRSMGDYFGPIPAGAFKLEPYLGYAFTTGSAGSIGVKASYEVISSDTSVDNGSGTDLTVKGGNAGHLAAFYEGKAADITLGGALLYDFFAKTQASVGGTDVDIAKSHSLIGAKFYADMPFGTGISFLPSLLWQEKASSDDVDKSSNIVFTVAGRFTF